MDAYKPAAKVLVIAESNIRDAGCAAHMASFVPKNFRHDQIFWITEDDKISHSEAKAMLCAMLHQDAYDDRPEPDIIVMPSTTVLDDSVALVKRLTSNPCTRLVWIQSENDAVAAARISSCFSAYGRTQDSLFIISKPPADTSVAIHDIQEIHRNYSLHSVPFVRTFCGFRETYIDDGLSPPLKDLTDDISRFLQPDMMTINLKTQSVLVGNLEVGFSPLVFAFYFWLVRKRKECETDWVTHGGFIRYDDPGTARDFLSIYRHYCDELSSHYEKAEQLLAKGFPRNYFLEKVSLIRASFREVLGNRGEIYAIQSAGKRRETRHGLTLPPELIQFIS